MDDLWQYIILQIFVQWLPGTKWKTIIYGLYIQDSEFSNLITYDRQHLWSTWYTGQESWSTVIVAIGCAGEIFYSDNRFSCIGWWVNLLALCYSFHPHPTRHLSPGASPCRPLQVTPYEHCPYQAKKTDHISAALMQCSIADWYLKLIEWEMKALA